MKFDLDASKFVKAVDAYAKDVLNEIAGATKESGMRIEKEAVSRAAVDTGYMKGHIRFRYVSKFASEVRSGANYSIYVDKGTRKMVAQPFMTPAVENESRRYIKICKNIIKNGVK